MSVTPINLLQGPAVIYAGIFGVTEPTITPGPPQTFAAPTTGWVDVGATDGGLDLIINDDYSVLGVDQIIYEVERRRTKRVVQVKTALAEATLQNLAIALNNTAPTGGAGAYTFTPDDSSGFGVANAPAYQAFLFDGIAPGGFKRRFIARKALATESVTMSYKKDGQTMIPATFTLHWISPSIKPFYLGDAGA
jgi:hypothetical protein